MKELAAPYQWESDVVLPGQIRDEINGLLSLAASCHRDGIDMRHVFIGLDAENNRIFIDLSDVPKALIAPWVMMNAEKHNCVALVMCTEGYTVPPEVAKRWMKDGRPSGTISEQPEAIEILMINVETQAGFWMGQAKIIGEHPNRSLDDIIHVNKVNKAGGQYNNLLRCHWTNDPMGTLRKAAEAMKAMDHAEQQAE